MPASSNAGNFPTAAGQCSDQVDDGTLLERARMGDAEAFSALFARHQRPLYRYAVHMCGGAAGDDIVQDTFLAVLKQGGMYQPSLGTVRSYLFGIARHIVFKRIARTPASEPLEDETIERQPSGEPSALDHLTHQELIEAVRTAVQELPPLYREVVVLCEFEEIDYADAATAIGCPVGTVRSRLHRAKAMLEARLAAMRPALAGGRR